MRTRWYVSRYTVYHIYAWSNQFLWSWTDLTCEQLQGTEDQTLQTLLMKEEFLFQCEKNSGAFLAVCKGEALTLNCSSCENYAAAAESGIAAAYTNRHPIINWIDTCTDWCLQYREPFCCSYKCIDRWFVMLYTKGLLSCQNSGSIISPWLSQYTGFAYGRIEGLVGFTVASFVLGMICGALFLLLPYLFKKRCETINKKKIELSQNMAYETIPFPSKSIFQEKAMIKW